MKTIITFLIAAAALLTFGTNAVADAPGHAASIISSHKAVIATLAHPTATLKRIELNSSHSTSQGFAQEYEFYFAGLLGKEFHITLEFDFDSTGAFAGELTVKHTTSLLVKPFSVANALVSAMRNELLKNPSVKRQSVLVAVLDHADAEKICEISLLIGD